MGAETNQVHCQRKTDWVCPLAEVGYQAQQNFTQDY